MVEKSTMARIGEDNSERVPTTEIDSPKALTVENLRRSLWETLEATRTGRLSVLQAAVISRLAQSLLSTYRIVPSGLTDTF